MNSVIGLLLRHNKAEIRTLGARLLAQFEKVQVSSLICCLLCKHMSIHSPCLQISYTPVIDRQQTHLL